MTKSYGYMLITWVIFPIVFVISSEIGGPFAHWYPYFFLDPQKMGGLVNLLAGIFGIVVLFLVVGSLIYWLYRKRAGLQIVQADTGPLGDLARGQEVS